MTKCKEIRFYHKHDGNAIDVIPPLTNDQSWLPSKSITPEIITKAFKAAAELNVGLIIAINDNELLEFRSDAVNPTSVSFNENVEASVKQLNRVYINNFIEPEMPAGTLQDVLDRRPQYNIYR